MTVIEFTGKDFKAYRDYLNNLQDHWWDHTALIGLKDIEKNNMLVHALLSCKTAGKFAEYYYNNRFVVDKMLGDSLLNFVDQEVKSNLKTILETPDATMLGKKYDRTKKPDFGGIQTSVSEKNAINWILEKHAQKLEDEILRAQPEETSMPTTDSMYASIDGQYYPRLDGDFLVLDPATSSGALG